MIQSVSLTKRGSLRLRLRVGTRSPGALSTLLGLAREKKHPLLQETWDKLPEYLGICSWEELAEGSVSDLV